jgi:hypothetical protein
MDRIPGQFSLNHTFSPYIFQITIFEDVNIPDFCALSIFKPFMPHSPTPNKVTDLITPTILSEKIIPQH